MLIFKKSALKLPFARKCFDQQSVFYPLKSATASLAKFGRARRGKEGKQMAVPGEEATRAEPPSLSSIPDDVLQALKDLNLRSEAAPLQAASDWCAKNEPGCLADIQGEPKLSEFLAALGLAKIPEKKLRAKLVVTGHAAKYESIRLIGTGGFGKTDLVRDRRSDEQFASKEISELTKEEADEALKEFDVMQKLRHQMLVEALESFCEPCANGGFTVRIAFALTTLSTCQ